MQRSEIIQKPDNNYSEYNFFLAKVYGWTFLGLLLSAITAFSANRFLMGLLESLSHDPEILIAIVFFEFALVGVLKGFLNRIPNAVLYAIFAAYAMLNGFLITAVFNFFRLGRIPEVLSVIAVMFAIPSVLGLVFKVNLADLGGFFFLLFTGLAALIAFNIFQNTSKSDWIISGSGLLIFLVLALVHRKKTKIWMEKSFSYTGDGRRPAILGALMLYLDFIVLFIFAERFIKGRD